MAGHGRLAVQCARYNIETESLEDIAAETIEGLQDPLLERRRCMLQRPAACKDGEVQKETADSMSEAEAMANFERPRMLEVGG